MERGAAPGFRVDRDGAAERLDVAAHHVQADTAARDVTHRLGGREARPEDEAEDLVVGGASVRRQQPDRGPLPRDRVAIEPPAIVGDLEMDVAALLVRAEAQTTDLGLAGEAARLRRLDAVVDRVPKQMGQRIGDLLDHSLVQLRVLA